MYTNTSFNRPTTDSDFDTPTRDEGGPFIHNPVKTTFDTFAAVGKHMMLEHSLNWELQDKYTNRYGARFKSKVEIGSIPEWFNSCIPSVDDTFLNPREKNWLRECYFKRVNAKDDMAYFMLQLWANEKFEITKEGVD